MEEQKEVPFSKHDFHHRTGLDIESRSFMLVGEINESRYALCRLNLDILLKESHEDIYIYLNTYGGDLYQGFAIYDLIKIASRHANIYVIADGPCMSAGALILQAGTKRYAMENAYIMMHEGYTSVEGDSTKAVKDTTAHMEEATNRMKDIIKRRTKQTMKTLKKWFASESYFPAEQAKQLKIIDEIWRKSC